jgi:outer membrane lipoprotein LolB
LSLNLASEPPRSFFATFELKGNASDGELTLTGPLGSVLAAMRWAPGEASLRTGQETQLFDSMESLTGHVTGASLPVSALFDWLVGVNSSGAGWQADLSLLDQGRLVATRTEPAPAAELKLILDR